MIRGPLDRFLTAPFIAPASVAASFVIGMVFIVVWAPHPWGWYGIDRYHQLAIELAQGRAFPTLDVPWGYAYFLSLFYRLFGPHPLPPLVAQAALNAAIPALIYKYAWDAFNARVAAVAALLTGLLSFNTVYASTESSDSVCTFLFVLMVVVFVAARRRQAWRWFALTGAIGGVVSQFRPNLILVPLLLAALHFVQGPRDWRRLRQGLTIVLLAAAMLVPWTLRNFRLTGEVMPTSTHGGVQLWYGTLQVGAYADARQYNPRRIFETPVFDYSSLVNVPIIVEGSPDCMAGTQASASVVYWTDAEVTPRRIPLERGANERRVGAIPAQFRSRTIYYYFEVSWLDSRGQRRETYTPEGGPADPFLYFLSADHLGDLDSHDALMDIFDLVELLRHIAWAEPVRAASKLDLDRNGRLDESDLRAAVTNLLDTPTSEGTGQEIRDILIAPADVHARFVDGSELVVPRSWNGLITDLQISPGLASKLINAFHRFTGQGAPARLPSDTLCRGLNEIHINDRFYRTQPHEMRRYTALAFDNIRRDPGAYASSVVYRALRLFVIRGTDDRNTAFQFAGSRLVYSAASVASASYLLLFLLGVLIAWRRGYSVWLPLALVVYIPATIAFVLTNMRYTVTVQPFMFVFVAVSLVALLEQAGALSPAGGGGTAARHLEENRTTSQP